MGCVLWTVGERLSVEPSRESITDRWEPLTFAGGTAEARRRFIVLVYYLVEARCLSSLVQ